MIRVTAFYRWKAGARFDHEYYRTTHMPFARRLLAPLGLLRLESDRFLTDPQPRDGDMIAATYAYFQNAEVARAALATAGQDLLESVPNYSTLKPELVMSVVTSHL